MCSPILKQEINARYENIESSLPGRGGILHLPRELSGDQSGNPRPIQAEDRVMFYSYLSVVPRRIDYRYLSSVRLIIRRVGLSLRNLLSKIHTN